MPAELSPAVARLMTVLERYAISALFFLFAWQHGQTLALYRISGSAPRELGWLNPLLLLLFNLFVGIMLLFGRRPARPPRQARELFVPLLATFLLMAFNFVGAGRLAGEPTLVPASWLAVLRSLAAVSTTIGYGFALWGALALGRSFGVYVAVREVVTHGPYRWVRHPIYTGYLFVVLALVLADPRPLTLAVAGAFVAVMVYRARLEEWALANASEPYRRYQETVGFLLPRFGRRR